MMPTQFKAKACLIVGALIFFMVVPAIGDSKQQMTVQLGVVVALSGKAQAYGEAVVQGAQLAVDEINGRGGVLNHTLSLVFFDNKSSAIHARNAALQAVYHKVTGVVGAVWSTHSLAMAPVFQKHGIPMISPGSTAPEVTQVGPYIFRVCYTDDFQGKLLADFAFHGNGCHRAAILSNIDETYSQRLSQYFSSQFIMNGGDVVFKAGYKGLAVDFHNILQTLKTIQPDVIFVPGYSRDSGLILKQARRMGIRSTFLGGDAWETTIMEYAGSALEGSYFSTFWHSRLPYQRNAQFIKQFESAYGKQEISAYAAHGYDAVMLFADAIARARSLDPDKIRDALAATHSFEGATGRIAFNAYGDPVRKGASILKFHNGRWQFYKAFEPK